MKPAVLLWLGIATVPLVAPGCGGDEAPEELSDPDLAEVHTNPSGDPYPTDGIGGRERGSGRRGDRIPNFTFRGYRDGDRSAGLQTIALADYYDPQQLRHKVLHIQLAATWCSICSSELSATVTVTEPLKERGIELLEIVVSGATVGKGPALGEVDEWMARHGTNFSTAIDVRGRRVSAIGVNVAVMPHDILVDTRTMEILDSSPGAPIDVAKYALEGLRWVTENPPSYP